MGASPSVPQKSVHDFSVKDCKNKDVDLSICKGKVLIVNVVSNGFTNSNYTELTELYNRYKGKGEDAQHFACTRFKAEYPVFQKEIAAQGRSWSCALVLTACSALLLFVT